MSPQNEVAGDDHVSDETAGVTATASGLNSAAATITSTAAQALANSNATIATAHTAATTATAASPATTIAEAGVTAIPQTAHAAVLTSSSANCEDTTNTDSDDSQTRRFDKFDALWIAAGSGLILLGVLIGTHILSLGARTSGELGISHWLATHRTPALNTLAITIHYLLGPFIAVLMLLGAFLTALLRDKRRLALVLAIVPTFGWGCAKIAKTLWNRPRPPATDLAALVRESSASFPSGHTAFAAALVATLVAALAIYRKKIHWWVLLAGVAFVALVGFTRVYAGAHYLADVLSAPLYCWGAVALIAPTLRRLRRPLPVA